MQQPFFGKNWSRAKYDQDYLNTELKQSVAPLTYSLDPNYAERCRPCFPNEIGWIGKQGVSYDASRPMIDTETDLFNIGRVLSKDVHKYRPSCVTGRCVGVGVAGECPECQPKLYHFPTCNQIKYESTRLSNPTSTLKETGTNRFQPICLNPQDNSRWEFPGEIGINYRMVVKDNHVPCIPHPIDQTPCLPKGGPMPCTLIHPTCAAPVAPLHHYRVALEQRPINRYK